MIYFKDPQTKDVYAYSRDQIDDGHVKPDLVQMTTLEVESHLNPPIQKYIPAVITRAQGKAAFINAGLWADLESYIDNIADETQKALMRVVINDATQWKRSSALLNEIALGLGMANEQLDDLFIAASKIEL